MQLFQILTLLAVVGSTVSAPAQSSPSTRSNWPLLEEKVHDLELLIRNSIAYIGSVALNDDSFYGPIIQEKLGNASVIAREILDQANTEIADHTMTHSKAEEYLKGQLEPLLLQLESELAPSIAELSPAAQAEITSTFTQVHEQSEILAQEIYDALDEIVEPDWEFMTEKTVELELLVAETLLSIYTTATNDDPQIGETIAEKLSEAAVDAQEIIERAQAEIEEKMLTLSKAQEYFREQLEPVLVKLQEDLKEDVEKLSAIAQNNIRMTFDSAYVKAQAIAQDIYLALT